MSEFIEFMELKYGYLLIVKFRPHLCPTCSHVIESKPIIINIYDAERWKKEEKEKND